MNRKYILISLIFTFGIVSAIVPIALLAVQAQAGDLAPTATTITLWHDESDNTVLNLMVAGFQSQYPTITVQVSYKDDAAIYGQYVKSTSAGAGPDLIRGHQDWIVPLAEMGLVRPVDAYFDLSLFVTQTISGSLWSGQHWGIPETFGNHLMLYYNKNLLASAPISTTQMISVAKSLTGGGQYGLVYNLNEPYWLIPWLTGFGGWVLDENSTPVTPTLNTPAMIDALQFVHDLRWVHGIVPTGTVDYNTAEDLFRNGKAAMMINGDWALAGYRSHFSDANLGAARLPLVAGTGQWPSPMVSSNYYLLNINSSGEKLAAAELFIQYATSKPAQLLRTQSSSILPARLTALNDPIIQMNPILQASADQAGLGRLQPTSPEMNCVWNALFDQIPFIMDDLATPAAAAGALQVDAAACVADLNKPRIYLALIATKP